MLLQKIVVCLLILIVVFSLNESSLASHSDFVIDHMSSEEQDKLIESIRLEQISAPQKTSGIICFDVSDSELIALGFQETSDNSIVQIYNQNGDFLYGYMFHIPGTFGLKWNNDDLIICFDRSDFAIQIDEKSHNLEIEKLYYSEKNEELMENAVRYNTSCYVGDCKYEIKNNYGPLSFIQSSYSQLIKTEPDGTQVVLYDVNSQQIAKFFAICFLVITILTITISLALGYAKQFYSKRING